MARYSAHLFPRRLSPRDLQLTRLAKVQNLLIQAISRNFGRHITKTYLDGLTIKRTDYK